MSQAAPRFQLFVKAGNDGVCYGDCPFSQRALMLMRMKVSVADVQVTPVDTANKPEYFVSLNAEGKVPVLLDRGNGDKVIADSSEIVKYLNDLFPQPDVQAEYTGPGMDAVAGVFPKFAAFLKNKDAEKEDELKANLVGELKKLDDYLRERSDSGSDFLLCGQLTELDCQTLPKLRHVQVAGERYKGFQIPEDFTALKAYIKCGEANSVFKSACPPDEQIVWGWSKFFK